MRYKILGEYLRKQRIIRHMTLKQLADMCGISVAHLSRVERGKENVIPNIELLEKFAKALCISIEKILLDCGYMEKDVTDIEKYRIIENFFMQADVRNTYQLDVEEMSLFDKQELFLYIVKALDIILYKYR